MNLKLICFAVCLCLAAAPGYAQVLVTPDGKEVSKEPMKESKGEPELTPEQKRQQRMKGEKKTDEEKEEILNKEGELKPEIKKIEGHSFPAEAVWTNTLSPVSSNIFDQKIVLVVVSSFDCLECGYYVHELQKSIENTSAIQLLQVVKGDPSKPISRNIILQEIQQNGYTHPVGVLPDFAGFTNTTISEAPFFLLYEKSRRPSLAKGGLLGYNATTQKLNEIKSNKTLLASCLNYRMAPEVAYDKWASPLIENPTAAAVDSDKGILYVYDAAHNRIVGLDGAGNCTSVIGSGRREFKDDVLTQAGFNSINGMCYNDNKLYLADAYNHRIRIVDLNSNRVSTLLGNGLMPADPSKGSEEIPKSMGLPTAVAMWNGELMAASGFTNEIFKINIADGKTTRFARTKDTGKTPDGVFIRSMTANKEFLYVAMSNGDLILYDKNGAQNVVVKGNTFKPSYLTIWKSNIVATGMHSNNVCMLDKGEWLAISGNGVKGDKDGKAYEASFNTPTGMAVLNGELIICDTKNHQLRKLSSPKNGNMRTLYYVPNRELIGEAAAHTEGEMVVMDTIVVGKSNTKIHVSLDLGNYKLIPEWSNADIDELDGAWLTTQEVTEDGFDFMINSKFEGSDVYLELYLLLEDPIVKGVYIVKRSYLSFYIESKNSAPAGQSKVYKVNVLPQ